MESLPQASKFGVDISDSAELQAIGNVMTPEDRREARQYAWSYFSLHADQRMRLFNFFLLISGAFIGALPAVKQLAPNTRLIAALPIIHVFLAFIFWRLDERTRMLIKNAEDALKSLDANWDVGHSEDEPHPLRLFERDDVNLGDLKRTWWANRLMPISYSDAFRLTYLLIGCFESIVAAWTLRGS